MLEVIRKELRHAINPQLIAVCGATWNRLPDINEIDGIPVVILSCFGPGFRILTEALTAE